MIPLKNTIVSDLLLDRKFVCDLQACKGACCLLGATGAPLEKTEQQIIQDNLEEIKPFMTTEGLRAIAKNGIYSLNESGDSFTTLVPENNACAFVFYDEKQIAKCAIEAAHKSNKINFKKPISCHLYPVRITKYPEFDAVNFDQREECKPACLCGEKLATKVYRFLKEPLIRKYGEDWYQELEKIDRLGEQSTNNTSGKIKE